MIGEKIGQVDFGEHAPTGVTVGVDGNVLFFLPLWREIWRHETEGPGEGNWQPMLPGMEPQGYGRTALPDWLQRAISEQFPDKGNPPNWRDMVVVPCGKPVERLIELLQQANEAAMANAPTETLPE